MGSRVITFSRQVASQMGAAVFLLGIAAFVLSALDPSFRPLAIVAFLGGVVCATILCVRHTFSKHPSLKEERSPEDSKPIDPM